MTGNSQCAEQLATVPGDFCQLCSEPPRAAVVKTSPTCLAMGGKEGHKRINHVFVFADL